MHRIDRPPTQHVPSGGCIILVKNNITHMSIHLPQTSFEAVGIKLPDNTHIVCTYNRPANKFSSHDLQALLHIGGKVLLVGDFNANHPAWNCQRVNVNGTTLHRYAQSHNSIILYPPTPTHYPVNNMTPSTIDLFISKNVANISDPITLPELNSDHCPVIAELSVQNNTHTDTTNYTRSYKHTDWAEFRRSLDGLITITQHVNTTHDLDMLVETFTQAIQHALEKHTRVIKLKAHRDELPAHITTLIKQRNATRKLWQRRRDPAFLNSVKALNAEIKYEIKTYRNNNWKQKLEALNPNDNSLWKLSKNLRKPSKPIPTLQHAGNILYSDEQKAEAIAEAFEAVHHIEPDSSPEQIRITTQVNEFLKAEHFISPTMLAKLLTSPSELASIIKKLPNQKAPGSDSIQNVVLKNFSRKALCQLTYIINASIKLSHFPACWKSANVIPIPKPNKDPQLPLSYRPISLLSVLSKVAEKVILHRLQKHDRKFRITPAFQFGFKPKHSTVQQVARIVTHITTQFNKQKVTVMALLDVEKAFDKVWLEGITYKLIRANFPPILVKLVFSYLVNRNFRVKINNKFSAPRPILAGVPQGSCLGPFLFILYLYDFPTFPKTETALYADDTALYSSSFSAEVANKQIQIHLNILVPYWRLWKIQINHTKTETIVFTRKHTNNKVYTPLSLHGHTTRPNKSVKYLGVVLEPRLFYNPHINNAVKKANIVIRSMYPLLSKNSSMNPKNKKLLYTAIIRPIITYANPVWCSASKTATKPLQRLQNKCLRLINNRDRYSRIADLHEQAQLPYIHEYISKASQKFYTEQIHNNPSDTQHHTNQGA